MNLRSFETRTFGKWILSGEHTVIRGGKALVFPLTSQFLDWRFIPEKNKSLEVSIPSGYPSEFKLIFWTVFEKACALKNIKPEEFQGTLEMKAQILIGSGMGASATLCVALTRWFQQLGIVADSEAFQFSKTLEDVFHGESSGVDVAVVMKESGLIFQKGKEPEVFKATWQPEWYLSHCGQKGVTKECVNKVKSLEARDPKLFHRLDEQMKQSVEMCLKSLTQKNQYELIQALNLSHDCFEKWDLITPALQNHIDLLRMSGCLALKPTGSGGGGFVLSLWSQPPEVAGVTFLKASVV